MESAGETIMNNSPIVLEKLHEKVYRVKFPIPTIVRIGKFATELVPAYAGSLWGSKRWKRKWGVEIYSPAEEKEYKCTFREYDKKTDTVFEFEITSSKLFENKREMKKFLETMSVSPFVTEQFNRIKES